MLSLQTIDDLIVMKACSIKARSDAHAQGIVLLANSMHQFVWQLDL